MPTSADDAFITPLSGVEAGGTIGDGSARSLTCKTLTMSQGGTVTITATTTITSNGNTILKSISNSAAFALILAGSSAKTLTTNGTYIGSVTARNGDTTIADPQNSFTGNRLTIESTGFDFAGASSSWAYTSNSIAIWQTTSGKVVRLRGGTFTVYGAWSDWGTSFGRVDYGTSTIRLMATSAKDCYFGSGAVVNVLEIGTAANMIQNAAGATTTINQLRLASGNTLNIDGGTTWVLTNPPTQSGTATRTRFLRRNTTNGTTYTISCSGLVALTNVQVDYCVATGGGTFTGDAASSAITNSTGWSLTHMLSAAGITLTMGVGAPTVSQDHSLQANGITLAMSVPASPMSQEHAMSAAGITVQLALGTPSINQDHALSAVGIQLAHGVGSPSLSQDHVLAAAEIVISLVLGLPEIIVDKGFDPDAVVNWAMAVAVHMEELQPVSVHMEYIPPVTVERTY